MSASQGNISQPSHPKRVWVSFCGRGDGRACTDVSAAGLWSAARCWGGSDPYACHPAADCNQTPPGRRSSGTAIACFQVPRQKTSRKRKIPRLVCLPEILPCFFFTAPPLFSIPAKHCLDLSTSCACPLQNGVRLSCCHRQRAACGVFGTRFRGPPSHGMLAAGGGDVPASIAGPPES